ncbi:MAG: hypothetical protein IJ305_01215 [Oscillospiraceae bacterium]|nr:hypothetical protein [Oscillospiraceae bacterium]
MKNKIIISLICGMLGCILMASGDWLMMYGDISHSGELYWLTEGVKNISPERNSLAMLTAFPAIILYAVALFGIEKLITTEKHRKIYHSITIASLTPWLCLHLFYVMILFSFAWLSNNGFENAANPLAEALYNQFSWIVIVSEIFMLPPYIYWFYLAVSKKTAMPKPMAFANPLIFYIVLSAVKFLPESPFRLAFINGLMSEAMLLWFGAILILRLNKGEIIE